MHAIDSFLDDPDDKLVLEQGLLRGRGGVNADHWRYIYVCIYMCMYVQGLLRGRGSVNADH